METRLGIPRKRGPNARFRDLAAAQVAWYVEKWRRDAPEQWSAAARIDVPALRDSFDAAKTLDVDPYLVGYVVMGTEWLFRVRRLTQDEILSILDQAEATVGRLVDTRPWVASLATAALAPQAAAALAKVPFYIGMGQWSLPGRGWRTIAGMLERDRKRKTVDAHPKPAKSGAIPALSPIIAGLVAEGLAERALTPRRGNTAFALKVASNLRGRRVQLGEFGEWRASAEQAPPSSSTGDQLPAAPASLREWLVRRWQSAYDIAFMEGKRTWSAYLVEAAHNPLTLFAPLCDLSVLSQLYATTWHRRRPKAPRPASAQRPGAGRS